MSYTTTSKTFANMF